jgi:hypothetical protein
MGALYAAERPWLLRDLGATLTLAVVMVTGGEEVLCRHDDAGWQREARLL